MGTFIYDGMVVEIDDRTLIHLQVVMIQKLRRGESFLLSWKDSDDIGGGSNSVWMHPTVPIRFKFSEVLHPQLNEVWLKALIAAANSPRGLVILEETGQPPPASGGPIRQDPIKVPVLIRTKQKVASP